MPMSDELIDEFYGDEILAIHMDRGGNSEEHVTYFLGAGRIWLYRAEIITRMMRGKKFYVRKDDWQGELEIVQDETTNGSYLRTIPDSASPHSLLSLPRV